MSADLETTLYLRRKADLEAINPDASYGGVLAVLGYTPKSDARYVIQASEAMFAGSGVQQNRRKLEARLIEAGYLPAESEI